jgi:type 1 glutamine amidotransferase
VIFRSKQASPGGATRKAGLGVRTAPGFTLLLVAGAVAALAFGHSGYAQHTKRLTRVAIVTGEDSYPGHHWKDTSAELKTILEAGKPDFNFDVTIEADPNFLATSEIFKYDVLIFDFRNAEPLAQDEKDKANLLKFLGKGKGLVTTHWANDAFPYWPEYNNIVGRSQQLHHDKRGPFTVKITDHDSLITKGMADFQTDDELYYDNKDGSIPVQILATAHSNVKDADFPMALTVHYKKGRVFNTPLGHDVKALQVPQVGELIRRGTAWAAGTLM